MVSQAEASRAMSSLLTGGRLLDVNYVSPKGEFALDDPSRVEDLVGLGRAEAAKKNIANIVARDFLNGFLIHPYIPEEMP